MAPVRIRYYGLLWITRRTYLVFEFIALLLSIALMVVGLSVMLRTDVYFPHVPVMNVEDDLIYQVLLCLFWAGLAGLLGVCIESVVMLRKFARAEAAQKASLADVETLLPPAPDAPISTAVQLPPNQPPNTNIQP